MKKIITLITICIIICFVFASCKSNMSLTKRHYNNGYYIAHSKELQHRKPSNKEEKVTQSKTKTTLYSVPNAGQLNKNIGYVEKDLAVNNKVVGENSQKKNKTIVLKKSAKQRVNAKTGIITYPIVQIKHKLTEIKKIDSDSSDKDGLSLFWIIILVLLILWAFGFLSGEFVFGGLIHILLVVALILLILWLLRII